MQKPSFQELGLSAEILQAVANLGFEEASPIQAAAIPVIMAGRDIVGQSQTGSGKTAAFAIPAIEKIDASSTLVQVLILCPTRELATQVADEVHKLTAYTKGIHAVPIYGGASYDRQFYELRKGVQIVIGTPGRVIDHIDRGTLKMDGLKIAILDEADRMLDMGFRDDIQKILDATPESRQTVFFSATMSKPIRELIGKYSRDPEMIKITQKEMTVPTVEQQYFEIRGRAKFEALTRLIDFHGFKLGLVFCNTQRMVDELADMLQAQGFAADRLHGGIPQGQRTRVMNKFKNAEFEFLVATDVAARGIDVDELELVVNYDLPYDAEDYVHRIGRTGRAGRKGMAVTFVSGREIYKLQFIERYTKTKIRRGSIPSQDEVEMKRTDVLYERVRTTLESGDFKPQDAFVDRLLERGFTPTDIASALLHHLIGAPADAPKAAEAAPVRKPAAVDRPGRERPVTQAPAPAALPRQPTPAPRPSAPEKSRPSEPVLRKASQGMTWVRLNVGKDDGVGPRDVVDLLVNGAKLPGNLVGIVELQPGESYAQVMQSDLPGIAKSVRAGNWQGRDVKMEIVRHGGAGSPREKARAKSSRDDRRPASAAPQRKHSKPWKKRESR